MKISKHRADLIGSLLPQIKEKLGFSIGYKHEDDVINEDADYVLHEVVEDEFVIIGDKCEELLASIDDCILNGAIYIPVEEKRVIDGVLYYIVKENDLKFLIDIVDGESIKCVTILKKEDSDEVELTSTEHLTDEEVRNVMAI